MKLRINKIENMKKLKLVKTSIIIGTMIPTIFTGCSSVDLSKYYLVHNNGSYYICTKGDKYINSCDIEYKSITDGKIVGVVCNKNNDFDYQSHRLSTEFLSELQICNIRDVLNENVSFDQLKSIASSDKINQIGSECFTNKKYYFSFNTIPLEIYKLDSKIILGYDLSPKRLNGSGDYIYSIIDNDVINLSSYNVNVYNIGKYFNDNNYITYDTAIELVHNKKLVKSLEK